MKAAGVNTEPSWLGLSAKAPAYVNIGILTCLGGAGSPATSTLAPPEEDAGTQKKESQEAEEAVDLGPFH